MGDPAAKSSKSDASLVRPPSLTKRNAKKSSIIEKTQYGSLDLLSDNRNSPEDSEEAKVDVPEQRTQNDPKKQKGRSCRAASMETVKDQEEKKPKRRSDEGKAKENPWSRVYMKRNSESLSDISLSTVTHAKTDKKRHSVIVEKPAIEADKNRKIYLAEAMKDGKLKNYVAQKLMKTSNLQPKSPTLSTGTESHPSPRSAIVLRNAHFSIEEWFPVGTTIRTAIAKYEIREKLVGNSEHVLYKVLKVAEKKNSGDKKRYFAMKCDKRGYTNNLKIELRFLRVIHTMPGIDHKKFVQFIDHGCDENYAFIVQQLMGPNLQRLRSEILKSDFSNATAFRLAQATLSCVEEIHKSGYVHRAISLGAFHIGIGKMFTHIVLHGCGSARRFRYKNKSSKHRSLRVNGDSHGEMLYQPIAMLEGKDVGRKDDLESWFYVICDMFAPKSLKWRADSDAAVVIDKKRSWRAHLGDDPVFRNELPWEFRFIMVYIDTLTQQDDPNYCYLNEKLLSAMKRLKISPTKQYDWEKLGEPPTGETPSPQWTPSKCGRT